MGSPSWVLRRAGTWLNFGFFRLLRTWRRDCEGPRDDRGLDQGQSSGGGEKWLYSPYVLKEGLIG